MISAQGSSPANRSPAAYPASPDGLKLLIRDVFTAMKSKDDQEASAYFSSMTLPEHTAWFTKTFGPTEGARMDAKYANLLPDLPENLKGIFEYARKDDRTNPDVSLVEKSGAASGLGRAVVDAMLTPIPPLRRQWQQSQTAIRRSHRRLLLHRRRLPLHAHPGPAGA